MPSSSHWADLQPFLDGVIHLKSLPQGSFLSVKPLVAVRVKLDKLALLSYKGLKATLVGEE